LHSAPREGTARRLRAPGENHVFRRPPELAEGLTSAKIAKGDFRQ